LFPQPSPCTAVLSLQALLLSLSTSLDDSLGNVRRYLKIQNPKALPYTDALESTAPGRRGRKSEKKWHMMSCGLVICLYLRGFPSTSPCLS